MIGRQHDERGRAMAGKRVPTIDPNATPAGLINEFDRDGFRRLAGKLERIEGELLPLSRRQRLMLLNALLRAELDAWRAAEAARRG
jgi:hypothetical protein